MEKINNQLQQFGSEPKVLAVSLLVNTLPNRECFCNSNTPKDIRHSLLLVAGMHPPFN